MSLHQVVKGLLIALWRITNLNTVWIGLYLVEIFYHIVDILLVWYEAALNVWEGTLKSAFSSAPHHLSHQFYPVFKMFLGTGQSFHKGTHILL